MESMSAWAWVFGAVAFLGWLRYEYGRWQESVDRERFLLSMKAASNPETMRSEERTRLSLLRSRWWKVWSWLPERFGIRLHRGEQKRT